MLEVKFPMPFNANSIFRREKMSKTRFFMPLLIIISALFSACSKEESKPAAVTSAAAEVSENSDNEIWSITGYYLRTNHGDMLITEHSFTSQSGSAEIYYGSTIIYFEGEETGETPMDSLKTGDKIEVDVKNIMESYPAFAPLYGLKFIESGDISNIESDTLLTLEDMGYHAVVGEKSERPMPERYSGIFIRTETDCFLVPSDRYAALADIDFLEIHPASEFGVSGVSLDSFKTGDRIWVDIIMIQELYPPIAPIFGAAFIEAGDFSDIEPSVISKLSELGYTASE